MIFMLAPDARANTPQECIALWNGMTRLQQAAIGDAQGYMAACLAHKTTPAVMAAPAPDGAPAGATARCGDGTYSTDEQPRTMCLGHRGVKARLN